MKAKGIARWGVACALAGSINGASALWASDLLISEIMDNPAALAATRGEWFELYNPTGESLNLRGATLGDDGSDLHRIETDLLNLPGEYLTLARSDDPGFLPDYVYDGFPLANGGDEIVLHDAPGEVLRLDYTSGFSASGRSRELAAYPMTLASYALTPDSLRYGAGGIGTPGAPGSLEVSAVPLPGAAWLFVTGALALFAPRRLPRITRWWHATETVIAQSAPRLAHDG